MIPIMRPELPPLERYLELVRRIWDSHMLSNFGPMAKEFERKAQAAAGNPDIRCIASADLGLMTAIAALDLPEGAEAVLPSFTFNSTVNAALWNGLTPVFADIDPDTFNLDAASLRAAITPRTGVVIATHVFGNPCDVDALTAAAGPAPIVFDAAHAWGGRYRGRQCGSGTLGAFEVFSFSGTKLVTSAEGGLVAASNPEHAKRIEYLRAYGFQGDYESLTIGLNGKLSELNAALGVLTIDLVERAIERRHAIVARYRDALGGLGITFQQSDPRDRPTWKDFAILCRDGATRDRVEAALTAQDIQTKRYFRPAHAMRAFRRYATAPLPHTEGVYGRILCLPIFNEIADTDVDRIAGIVRQAAR